VPAQAGCRKAPNVAVGSISRTWRGGRAGTIFVPKKDFEVAQRLLQQIEDAFEDAEAVSALFKERALKRESNTSDLVIYNATADLKPEFQRLHITMHEVAHKRQKKASLAKKVKWAIYKKREFDAMIESVTGFVHNLVELFPAVRANQEVLCVEEVSNIRDVSDLALLGRIVGDDDKLLKEGVMKELQSRGHSFYNLMATDDACVHAGDNVAYGIEARATPSI
jgi:hypothetical protein